MNGSRHGHFNERIAVVILAYSAIVLQTFARTDRPQSALRQVTARVSTKSLEVATTPVGPSSVMIEQVRATVVGQSVEVRVTGNAALSCAPFRLNDPNRLVLDCAGAHVQAERTPIPVALDPVRAVRVGQFKSDVARVVIDLRDFGAYRIHSEGDTVIVTFESIPRPTLDIQSTASPAQPSPLAAKEQVEQMPSSTPPAAVDAPPTIAAEASSPGQVTPPLLTAERQAETEVQPESPLVESSNGSSTSNMEPKVGAPAALRDPASADREYVIGPQDLLAVNVWRDTELSRSVPVRPDGKISLPLVGEITASGLTPQSLQRQIAQGLDAYIRNPQVTVIVQEANSHKFYIIGEVERPGAYPLATRMTVLDALATAGGFRDFAKPQQIYLLRPMANGARQRIRFDYKAAMRGNNSYRDIELQTGDTLVVP